MPKHASLMEYFKAKWKGQLVRCKDQAKEIKRLGAIIDLEKKKSLDKHAQYCRSRAEIGLLRGQIKELKKSLAMIEGLR